MATNYDELTKRRNEMALERYYRLKNAGSSGNNYNGIAMATPRNDGVTATQEEKKNKGGLLGGLGYLGHELGLGVMRSIEGVVDYVGGGILDLFGADEAADELLKNDWFNYNAADEWYNPGAGWEFAGDVASGVGGMLPAVAVSFVPGVGGALSTATFGLGAAGQAVSEQTKKNGTASGKEWLYGTASGAMEAGIEAVSGGIGGTAAGKVLGKELAKTTGGKIATSFIGEGLEEVASDILNPALQRATGVDKDASVDWGNLPRTFLVGGATGAVMGGAGRALNAAQAGGFNNLAAAETAQEMDAQMSDNNVRQALGKKEIYTQKDMANIADRLSKSLQKMDEGTRSAFLAQNKRIAPLFDADGTVKQSVWEDLRTRRFSVENQENMSVGNSQSIGNLSGETYSSSLKGRESTLKYQPATSTQGTENARAALRNIELLSGGRVDVVLTSDAMLTADGQQANGEYADGVLYVNANADSYQRAMFIASHELTHTLEGTEAYDKLGAFIRERVAADPTLAEKYNLEKYRLAYENAQAGDFSVETLDYQAETEMYADFVAREILGNEDVVRRLVAKERNIAVRFLEWVRSALKRLGGSREAQAEYKALRKAEKLLSAALENAKGGVSLEEVEEDVQRRNALRDMFAQEGEEVKSEVKSAESETKEVKKETTEENSVDVGAHSARYSLDYINAEENSDIVALVDKVRRGQCNENEKVVLGNVSDSIAEKIFNLTNIDVKDFKIAIEARQIKHILNRHGEQGKSDQSMSDPSDLAKIEYAINNHEDIRNAGKTSAYKYADNGKTREANTILYETPIGTKSYYVVQAVMDTKKKMLFIVTAFIGKNSQKKEVSQIINAESPNETSKNESANTSTTIIRENTEKSTENAKKVEKSSRKSLDVEQSAKGNSDLVPYLRNYLHRLNISEEAKAEAIEKYGERTAKRLFAIWENTTGRTDAADVFAVHAELVAQGFDLYADTEAQFLRYMDKAMRGKLTEEEQAVVDELLDNDDAIEQLSREEAGVLVNKLLAKHMNYEEQIGKITGKTKAEVVQMLVRRMDEFEGKEWKGRQELAMRIASYLLHHTVFENVYSDSSNRKASLAVDLLQDNAVSEVKQNIARDILSAFNRKISMTQLEKKIDRYEKRIKHLKNKLKAERDMTYVRNSILYKAKELKELENAKFANASEMHVRRFKNTIGRLGRINFRGNLNKRGTRKIVADLATWYKKDNPMLEGYDFNEEIAEKLKLIASNTWPMTDEEYEIVAKLEKRARTTDYEVLRDWYTKEHLKGKYDKNVKLLLTELANPMEFSYEELKALENVIDYFKNFIKNYNKVYRAGKYVEAMPIAQKYVAQMQKHKRTKVGWFEKGFEGYIKAFGDPMTAARYFDKYEDGFFTEALEELRKGVIASQVMEQRMKAPLEKFYEKNKKFFENCEKRTIKYQGEKMNAQTAMLLYMTLKREQALRGLAYSGFKFNRGDDIVTVAPFATAENLDIDELKMQAAELQNELAKQFTEAEREYVAIVEKIFNEDCKKAKSETDMLRMGYTNILEGYYVPIRRASIAYNVEKQTYQDELASVSNQSFNKDTVSGARNQLFIDGLTQVAEKHIDGIAQYANLAIALDNYDILFNLNISGNPNMAITVKSEADNVWRDGGKYFGELINDIKGVAKTTGALSEVAGKVRGAYAKYQLGANLKVWFTQLSSLIAAGNMLDIRNIISGIGVGLKTKGAVLDENCGLAMVRNSENTAALAQGVLEKTTNKISDVLMKPIGAVDRLVVRVLYGACQQQIEAKGGAKVGTEENLAAAGELLERVILETQQNAMATERSAAMRSGSEFAKSITMFSADSMKLTGRVIDAIGEVSVVRKLLKEAKDANDVKQTESLKKRLTKANKQACRSMASMVTSAIFMAALTLGFKWVYDKDDKDEEIGKNLIVDGVGNLFGGLPVARDIYSYLASGYEVNNALYSSINDFLESCNTVFTLCGDLASGKNVNKQAVPQAVRKSVYALGQLTGLPTRNIYNAIRGAIGWDFISPATAYKIDDLFYKQAYRADLAKAIEKGDDKMIATIVGLMLNENIGGVTDATAREAIDALVASDFVDVIPRSVPDKVTYKNDEGESVEIELTAAQTKAFEKIYVVANERVSSLVKSSQYKNANQEAQSKAIDFIYDTYYDMAKRNLTGEGLSKAALFAEAIDIDNLAIILAEAKLIEADKKNGVTVSGSKKAKLQKYVNSLRLTAVQKYMIMGYLGYKNMNGADAVKTYIRRLNLSAAEKELLYSYSGYNS